MIELYVWTGLVVGYFLWMWYELTHPLVSEADKRHDECVKSRETDKIEEK